MFYILLVGQKGVLDPGQLRQLRHPGARGQVEPPVDTGTKQSVTVRSESQYETQRLSSQVEGEEDNTPHCNWVRRFVVDIAFHLA